MTAPVKPTDRKATREWIVLGLLIAAVMSVLAGIRAHREAQQDEWGPIVAAAARAGDIEMFTTLTCPYCAKARRWFARHHVSYRECNTDTQADCAARFAALPAQGVPALLVRGQLIVGFDPDRLAAALGLER